ncbi:MAG TPA: MFS transporter [Tepidisphaeraceae bacterium]|nr:MFS transporter [Tepidisphaeraceae bacterium]
MADPQGIDEKAPPLTFTQWLICFTAAMGFAFDIFALLMLPLVIRPALLELGNIRPGTPEFSKWFSLLFYIPAFAGGIFGLLGGYLTDRLGRRRILVWSILLYAFSAFASGYATSLTMLLILRCMTFIGVSVEFVAAVAWLAELFPHPLQREKVLGYTQAFSSIGGLMVALANGLAIAWVKNGTLPHIHIPGFLHPLATQGMEPAWRYTLISGLIPAIPLIIIRPFLPESPAWRLKKLSGTMKRPSIAAIFSPELARTTIVTTIMFACSYGAAFGAIQQMPQIVAGLPQVQEKIKYAVAEATSKPTTSPAGAVSRAATMPGVSAAVPQGAKIPPGTPVQDPRARAAAGLVIQETAASVTKVQEIGGLVGRVILAILATIILSRRSLIRVFQIPGLIVMPVVFCIFAVKDLNLLYVGMFIAGLLTVAQFSFWGNYLPRVDPMHLRGTGESFAANIGGRMIGTSFAALTAFVAARITSKDATPVEAAHMWAFTAAAVGFAVYLAGFLMSFFLPEPRAQQDGE